MTNWHALSKDNLFKKLGVAGEGLTHKEADAFLERYGPNQLEKKDKTTPLQILVGQFKSSLILILIFAALISGGIGIYRGTHENFVDMAVILIIVVLNAVLGFVQEYRAERAMEALEKLSAPKATVLRDGKKRKLISTYLVPGDIIFLETGDKVPADARLLDEMGFHVDEAALTGESVPVTKHVTVFKKEDIPIAEQYNMAFMGTVVTQGKARAIVVDTGMETEMGRIAELIQEAEPKETPLQKKLSEVGRTLGIAILFICALVFGLEVFRRGDFFNSFLIAVSLAVAAVPEGLPAVITISLALGLQKMARYNAVVRKLPVVEALGSTTVICSDKTGTLTKNEMTVRKVLLDGETIDVSGAGYAPEGEFTIGGEGLSSKDKGHLMLLCRAGALCNNSELVSDKEEGWSVFGDPTEGALVVLAEKAGVKSEVLEDVPQLSEISFSSGRKMMTTIHREKKGVHAYSKGAPEVILKKCSHIWKNGRRVKFTKGRAEEVLKATQDYAQDALRVLAIAYKELPSGWKKLSEEKIENGLTLVGLVGMIDPPRPEVKDAIKICNQAGIRTVMITGDHGETAKAIAKELELTGKNAQVLSGMEVDDLLDPQLREKVKEVSVFARVSPEHKVRILQALKANGEIVAMTGDGVNDAPALKNADIGIAMGIKGTDVAKEAADMVLEDDNFATIVKAVEQGRGIFDNIKKFVTYLLTSNAGELLIIFVAALSGMPLPLLAVQILWINLLTDGLPAVALSLDPTPPTVMLKKPRNPKERVIDKWMRSYIVGIGILMAAVALFLFHWALGNGAPLVQARTLVFATVVVFETIWVFLIRAQFDAKLSSNKLFLVSVVLSLLLLVAVIYVPFLQVLFGTMPLTSLQWLYVIEVSASVFVFVGLKILLGKRLRF